MDVAAAYLFGIRRQSPVATIAARCCRGSCDKSTGPCRAPSASALIRIAFSLASAPPLVKNTLVNPLAPGRGSGGLRHPAYVSSAGATVASTAALVLYRLDDLRMLRC